MRRLWFQICLVALVLLACLGAINPPSKTLRLGKDLNGGVSLTYSIVLSPSEDPNVVIPQIIEVLKQRVDPDAQSDIAFVREGRDRIEITMPLPTAAVKKLRAAFDAELAKFDAARLEPAKFEQLMRAEPGVRAQDIARLAGSDAGRAARLQAAAAAADAVRKARETLDAARAQAEAARTSGAAPERLAELGKAVDDGVAATAQAEVDYDKARDAVLGSVPTPDEVRRALELPRKSRSLFDESVNKPVVLPSPREAALQRLRDRYPGAVDLINGAEKAHTAYLAERRALDDPGDLKRLLAGAGVLDFRIAVDPGKLSDEAELRHQLHVRGPRNTRSDDAAWFKINRIDGWYQNVASLERLRADPVGYFRSYGGVGYVVEEFDGEYWMLCYTSEGNRLTRAEGDWAVSGSFEGHDELGRPAINFTMDAAGAKKLGSLTGRHLGDRMAVLLDDQVYTAPTLQGKISNNGQITGDFSTPERQYIIRTLRAGSLQAKLSPEPIGESTLGPELGADNLRAGFKTGVVTFSVVAVFMIVYYFESGLIAVIALAYNLLLVLAIMALNRSAFTLPGIAGIVLTFGQAIDSNVLIYERMREEFLAGADMKTAVRLGFSRAFSSIVDGNVANLIICVVLYYFGTQEIRGFAVTLGIGVVTTLFTALVVSRVIFTVLVDHLGWKRTSQLPMAFPGLQRALTPRVDWMGLRWISMGALVVFLVASAGLTWQRGARLLDTEFRGGAKINLQLRQVEGTTERMVMTRQEVQDRVKALGQRAAAGTPERVFTEAEIVPVNPRTDGVTSDQFEVRVGASGDNDAVLAALVHEFAGLIESHGALSFTGSGEDDWRLANVNPILKPRLGDTINRAADDEVRDYIGGVAIVLDNIQPPQSLQSLVSRLDQTRQQPDYSDTLARRREVRVLEGTEDAVTAAVILVHDDSVSVFENEAQWNTEVAGREWKLARDALTQTTALATVSTVSPTIAQTFKAKAVISVVLSLLLLTIYVWVRFGAGRWALAATVPLFADVIGIVGLIALAQILYENPSTNGLAHALGLLPFKIDLNQIAALLTITGYSLNDKIIILDRIRENKGRMPFASYEVINDSINQTLSRTIITAGTTLFSTVVLYMFGGEAVRGFAYAFTLGVIVGTYTSVVSSPLVWSREAEGAPEPAPQPG
ncbi:MAG: protein translocase subunit SecD [Phycisphaerales bacterium]|nr:protein translocase subunit SecD [Phycisphaerales bacterium]